MPRAQSPRRRCFNRRSCSGVEPACFLGRSGRGHWSSSRATVGGLCLILHLLRQLHLETLFISSAPVLQVLLTKAMGFKSTAPDQEGLCVWDLFFWGLTHRLQRVNMRIGANPWGHDPWEQVHAYMYMQQIAFKNTVLVGLIGFNFSQGNQQNVYP